MTVGGHASVRRPRRDGAAVRACNEAFDLASGGRIAEAITALERQPAPVLRHPLVRNLLGTLHMQAGRTASALQCFDAAVAAAPAFADAHCNRGVALQELGRYQEADTAYRDALKHAPAHVQALFNRGNILKLLDHPHDAIAAFSGLLEIEPGHVDAVVNRARVHAELGDFELALADFERALALGTDNANARIGRAAALIQLGRLAEAMAAVGRIVADHPGNADALMIQGRLLLDLGKTEEALEVFERLCDRQLASAKAHSWRSAVLRQLARYDEAYAAAEMAVRLDSQDAEARENLAHLKLLRGDFESGWREHEYRLQRPKVHRLLQQVQAPLWQGEDVAGKRIVLVSEQGLGDALMFVRYAKLLHERGATLVGLVQPALMQVLRSLATPVTWFESVHDIGGCDYQVPLLSLPYWFATRPDTIPGDTPYLFADPPKVDFWRARLGEGGIKVGIVWQGNPAFPNDRSRSVPLAEFAPLAKVPGVRLVSLQAVHGLDQLASLPAGMVVETLGDAVAANPGGLAEIAAAIMSLDLVIACDTALAHLAGALDRPVWVALASGVDWRWQIGRADSRWYPTMRLYRQPDPGNWRPVFSAMAQQLTQRGAKSNG